MLGSSVKYEYSLPAHTADESVPLHIISGRLGTFRISDFDGGDLKLTV